MRATTSFAHFVLSGLLTAAFGTAVLAEAPEHNPEWDYKCSSGFQWSRGTASCVQAECPEGAVRTYTYGCNCGEAWGKPFRTCMKDGLAMLCVAEDAPCPDEPGYMLLPTADPVSAPASAPVSIDIAVIPTNEAPASPTIVFDFPPRPKCEVSKHQVTRKDGVCVCAPLYKLDIENDCVFRGGDGIAFDFDSWLEFESFLDNLKPGEGGVFEGVDFDGKPFVIGVIKQADGTFKFTANGLDYFDTAREAVRPGTIESIKNRWSNLTREFGQFFGIGQYTGRDTAGNESLQKDRQAQLDAATAAFDTMRSIEGDPEKQFDTAKEIMETWLGRSEKLLGEQYGEGIIEELEKITGQPIDIIRKVIRKDTDGLQDSLVGKVKQALYGFPAYAVETLAKELRKDSFAEIASVYIEERKRGKQPEIIFAEFLQGRMPELDMGEIRGAGLIHSRGALFMAYEEAYHRYLIRNKLHP